MTAPLASLLAFSWPARLAVWMLWATLLGPLLLWCVRDTRPGAPRLLAAAPVWAFNLAVPLLFTRTEVLSACTAAVITSFLTNLKILAWILNRGSLVRQFTLPQFMAVVSLPLTPTDAPPEDSSTNGGVAQSVEQSADSIYGTASTRAGPAEGWKDGKAVAGGQKEGVAAADSQAKARRKGRLHEADTARVLFLRFVAKAVGLAAVTHLLNTHTLHPIPAFVIQTNMVYLLLSIGCDMMAALVSVTLGMQVAPSFDHIYAATSAGDFWSRRWNQIVSLLLRYCVYDPIMEGHLVHRPGEFAAFSRTRRLLGLLASFTVSGLLHEIIFWYATRRFTPHLRWFWFFTLWGFIIVAENLGKRVLRKQGITVPKHLARLITQIILHVMVAWGWMMPLNATGMAVPGLSIMQQATQNISATWRDIGKALLGRWVD